MVVQWCLLWQTEILGLLIYLAGKSLVFFHFEIIMLFQQSWITKQKFEITSFISPRRRAESQLVYWYCSGNLKIILLPLKMVGNRIDEGDGHVSKFQNFSSSSQIFALRQIQRSAKTWWGLSTKYMQLLVQDRL